MNQFFRFFYRNLKKNKIFSFIAIAGFTLSLTITLLLSSFVFYEISYDQFHSNLDRIYRLINQQGNSSINEDIVEPLHNDYPEIESVCRYNIFNGTLVYNEQPFELKNVLHTESSFFDIFDTEFILGLDKTAMDIKENVVLSEKTAQKIFGSRNPIGETITYNHEYHLIVAGVIKEIPRNSSFNPELIIHRDLRTNIEGSSINGVDTYYNRFFVLLNSNTETDDLSKKLSLNLQKQKLIDRDVKLLPFKNSYMNTTTVRSHLKHVNLALILILGGIVLIILFISALNFIILFTAHHLTRLKEIGLKRTIGMNPRQIFVQFLLEAVLICSLSFFISIISAELLHPYFENIVGKSFPLTIFLEFPNLVFIIVGVLVVAVFSGWYPALLVSRFQPHTIFRSSGTSGISFKIKSGLLTVQYAVTIVLIVSLIVISKQIDFIKNKNLGFNTEQLIRLNVHWKINPKLPILKQELMKYPYISYATSSNGGPGRIHCTCSWAEARRDGKWDNPVPYIPVDYNFFNVFDAPLVHGRNFREFEEDGVIMNETAWKTIGWTSLSGKQFRGHDIVGVVKDIHVARMQQKIEPTFFMLRDGYHTWLSIKIMPEDVQGTIQYIQQTWKKIVPEFVLDLSFYDDWINAAYQAEEDLAYAIRMFAIIAIMLACLGTFGVIQFITSRRTREIGIRKISGATTSQIVTLLNIDFIKWISLAFVVAVPLSWFIMKSWLEHFAYRTSLSWWIFILSGLITLVIALITISWQTVRAAIVNPVDTLRYE